VNQGSLKKSPRIPIYILICGGAFGTSQEESNFLVRQIYWFLKRASGKGEELGGEARI